ncbi:hypothetical protein HMI56_003187, partial [Coelomomyces lativittatus]
YQPYPSILQESGPNFFDKGPLGFSQGPSDSRTVHSTYQGSQAWNQMGSSSGMYNPADQQRNTFVSPSSPSTSRVYQPYASTFQGMGSNLHGEDSLGMD